MQFGRGGSWQRRSVEGEEAAEGRGGGEGAEAGEDVAAGVGQMVGELLERVLDRGAEQLQRGPVARPRRQAGVDRVGQLARQVGAEAPQSPGAAADRAGGGGGGGGAGGGFGAPGLVQGV